jgi:hypothetical protein
MGARCYSRYDKRHGVCGEGPNELAVEKHVKKLKKLMRLRRVQGQPNRHVVHAVGRVHGKKAAVDRSTNEHLRLVPKRNSPVHSNLHLM